MARAKAILQSDYPYTITARCINKEWFNLSMDYVWEIFCEQLSSVSSSHDLQIHSFVLMSNHFHLLASTPQANISSCMMSFMTKTSKTLTRAGNRINQTFAGRHYKCILDEHNYFMNAYKYNYRNPVTAGICEKVEDYPYSTLSMKLKLTVQKIPYIEDSLLSEDKSGILEWLNKTPESEALKAAKNGFKGSYFVSRNRRDSSKPILGPNDLL